MDAEALSVSFSKLAHCFRYQLLHDLTALFQTAPLVDCWDGDSGEPVIYHGRTLTRKLLLSEALKAISKHAFVASPYPLILSLEAHCQSSQQERLAEILKTYLGEALVDRRLDNDTPGTLPSPKDLMYRILVKVRKTCLFPFIYLIR